MIPRRNLSLLSNRLAAGGGRRVPEAVLERDYCIAWFLIGLAASPLRSRLVFKGGTALKRCYFGNYRFSEDMDFTLVEEISLAQIVTELQPVYQEVQRCSGIILRYVREDRHSHANTYTFYLGYEGPLPGSGKEIKVDVTLRELLVSSPVARPVLRAYEEYADLPEGALVQVYTLNEIALEKLIAVTDPARNEPRDLYDLWYLVEGKHVHLAELRDAFDRKRAFKGLPVIAPGKALITKEPRLRRDWGRRLSGQMVELPRFDAVLRSVRRSLRQAGLLGGTGR